MSFPDLMQDLDGAIDAGMAKAGGAQARGRFADALLDRAERLYASIFGWEIASARHAVAARKAHQRATAAKGRCRR